MKRTVRFVVAILVLCCTLLPTLVACNSSSSGATSGTDRLVVYNWEDYIDIEKNEETGKTLLNEFEDYYKEKTGRELKITYTTYDTNETMMTKVLKGDANVDLICPSEYSIEKLLVAGCLLNQNDIYKEIKPQLDEYGISLDRMSSLKSESGEYQWGTIDPEIMSVISNMFNKITAKDGKVHDMTEYMVPYMWGTLGILYNTSVVTIEELDEYGWGVLWNEQKNPELENMILMKDSVRDSYAAAVFYMYEYDLLHGTNYLPDKYKDYTVQELINCTDDEMVLASERVLTAQRDHISGYEVDFGKDDMINEIVYADFAWSGDALWAIEEGGYDEETDTYQLGYYIPKTCSNIWYDGWCIPTSATNKLAAMMFIDYMCKPMSSIRNSNAIGYSSCTDPELLHANEDVCAYLEDNEYDVEEYFSDTGRYPDFANEDDTYYQKLGVMRDFGSRNDTVVNMWQRAKSGSSVESSLWWIILAIVGAVGIAVGGYAITQALKRRPRRVNLRSDDGNNRTS